MLNFIALGSGSSGNCYYLNCNGYGLIIDLGIGIRIFKRHCSNYGLKLEQMKAILVTHDHTDHVKAVGVLARDFRIPVYTTEKVFNSMMLNHYLSKKIPLDLQHVLPCGNCIDLGPFHITSFHVPHDSADNNGYIIEVEDKCLVIMTDIGHFTPEMSDIVRRATHLIIESNYDVAMLAAGPYPLRLQNRISSPYGHISNVETADFLVQNLDPQRIRRVWLCHLSAENNLPRIALDTVVNALTAAQFKVQCPEGVCVETLPRRTPTLLTEL